MSFNDFDTGADVAAIASAINEVVSVSSSIFANDLNIKRFENISSGSTAELGGYWQTSYDSAYSGTTASPLLDFTFGYSSGSVYNIPAYASSSQNEKTKVYRMMAGSLLGSHDSSFTINSVGAHECFFVMVKRSLMKDELKKGSVSLVFSGSTGFVTASDTGAATNFKQTVGGDYAPLFSGSTEVGQVWYNSGIIIVPASSSGLPWDLTEAWSGTMPLSGTSPSGTMANNVIDENVDGFRLHTDKIAFHNQTNLYSTVYFCRAQNTQFNYSSNPTFIDDNKRIRVTSGSNVLQTRTYITTIGLYDSSDNLLAVGKLNKPITKSPDTESIFRVRLDY